MMFSILILLNPLVSSRSSQEWLKLPIPKPNQQLASQGFNDLQRVLGLVGMHYRGTIAVVRKEEVQTW